MINSQVLALNKSSTLKITALTKKLKSEGKDIVNFAAGEPDFDTPDFIKEAGKLAIDQGITKYTPSTGMPELKDAIAAKLKNENNIPVESKNIIVTAGAKYAIYAAILTLIDKDNEVIIPSPFWVSYPEMVKLTKGTSKILPISEKNGYKIDIEDLKRAITPKSKLLILNYPANPTGINYSQKELTDIFNVIKNKGIYVLSDEIYEKLIYDNKKFVSFASLPDAAQITITINGFSKAYSMTGWRLGYLSAPDKIADEASKIIDHTTSCAASIVQKAAIAALKNTTWPVTMLKEFQTRRDTLYQGLSSIKKINPLLPEGTFYMFCDIRDTKLSAPDFAAQLLEKHLVAVVPADDFGIQGFVRLSFATSLPDINKGIERMGSFIKTL